MIVDGVKLRYGAVAGICMVAHNLIVIGASRAGMAMPVAVTISFGAVAALGFVLHSRFTFAVPGHPGSFLRYVAGMASNLPLTILLLWVLADLLRLPMEAAAPAGTALLVAVNFFISRWAITSGPRNGAPA
jgi:putative flippase GtrA